MLYKCITVALGMPPKKKGSEQKADELLLGGDGESEMTLSSPSSIASLDSASVSLTADLLQRLLSNCEENQKSLMADNHAAMSALIASLPPAAPLASAPSKTPKIEVPKWKDGEAPRDYFLKYETAQSHNEVPRAKWGVLLHVYLSGAAQAAYGQVNPDHLDDYDRVKGTMLRSLRDTPEQADRNWWRLIRKAGETMGSFYLRMRAVAVRRFDGLMTREAMFEKVLLSRLLYLLPADQYNSVTMKDPKTAEDAADIVDDMESRGDFSMHLAEGGGRYRQSNRYSRRDNGQQGSFGHNKGGSQNGSAPSGVASSQESSGIEKGNRRSPTPPTSGNSSGSGKSGSEKKRAIICYSCREPGHIKPNGPNRVRRLSPDDDVDSENEVAEPMWVDGWIGETVIKGMRFDSGSDRTVVDSKFVPADAYLGRRVVLKGWRGKQASIHELAKVTIRVGDKLHKLKKVAVEANMEYPALLGADLNRAMQGEIMKGVLEEWAEEPVVSEVEASELVSEPRVEGPPAKDAMLSEAVRVTRAQARKERESDEVDVAASEQADCSPTPLAQIFDFDDDLFLGDREATSVAELSAWPQVVAGEEKLPMVSDKSTLVGEQVADDTLKPLHELAGRLEKGYSYRDGILVQGEEDCLGDLTYRVVVPKGRREALLVMAHSGLVSGHYGVKKTYAKLAKHFIWPRMWVEVKACVRSCGGCQRASRNTNARAPLQPLPCIGEPFHLVAFDLVGPIPKSTSGYRYILTMMDMFSKYPEAIPLKRVDNEAVLEGMLEIFSRHVLS